MIFIFGYPSHIGGANTELWHTLKLWRQYDLPVTCIPTWRPPPDEWRARLNALGVATIESSPGRVYEIPGLAGSIAVAFCNQRFFLAAKAIRKMNCRIVWANCMNWLFPSERLHYRNDGCGAFDAYLFQSAFQRDQLAPQLRRVGYDDSRGHMIRGYLDLAEFPFPSDIFDHQPGEPFVMGRISRAEPDKYHRKLWSIFGRVLYPKRRVRILGWEPHLANEIGPPLPYAECLRPGAESSLSFLRSLHCLIQMNCQAVENWPRVGLEAMAAGVPIIAENRGGWREMICHGETGYLVDSPDEASYYASKLAYDEQSRIGMILAARSAVERLCEPEVIWDGWRQLFHSLGYDTSHRTTPRPLPVAA